MSEIVYLWQADGPLNGGRGVCGELGSAREAAEGCLRRGAATGAVVEEAVPEIGIRTLADGYCRTGEAWRAEPAPGGGITWVPVTAAVSSAA
jgi:hypothetical protein